MGKLFLKDGKVGRKEAWQYCMGIYGQNLACAFMMNWFMNYCTDVLYIDGIIVGLPPDRRPGREWAAGSSPPD